MISATVKLIFILHSVMETLKLSSFTVLLCSYCFQRIINYVFPDLAEWAWQ